MGMVDLTVIPAFLRLFSFKLALVLDVFSRMPLAARVFLSEPSGNDPPQWEQKVQPPVVRRAGSPNIKIKRKVAALLGGGG
jgi:hypothetical protein